MSNTCPFCDIQQKRILYDDQYCFAIRDGYPISKGHSLVIPKRHVDSFFDITVEEKEALFVVLDVMKNNLDNEFTPDAYNIGINDGTEAGQTIPHLHIHLIPRYKGDSTDPRGGVRWVLPEKASYWNSDI